MKKVRLSMMLLLLLLLISACSSKEYETHLQTGKDALKEERYEDAIVSFKKAAKVKSTDEIQQYIILTSYMKDSVDLLKQGEFSSTISTSKKIIDLKGKDEFLTVLKPKALKLQKDAMTFEKQLTKGTDEIAKGKLLLEQNNFDDAYASFKSVSETDSQNPKLEKLSKEASDLMNQTLEKKNTFLSEQEEQEEAAKKAEEERLIAEEKRKKEEAEEQNQEQAAHTTQKISKEQAVTNVRQYLNLNPNPNLIVEYDHENENGDYVIHVYEIVIDNPETKEGHTATWGWYGVDPDNGFVYDAFNY